MKKTMLLAITTTIALTGCAGFIETKKASFSEVNTGISYYLPKRQHKLTVTAENLNAEKEEKKFHEAELLFNTKNELAQELKAKWEKLQAEADKTPIGKDGADTKAKARAVEKAQTDKGIYLAAQDSADKAKSSMETAKSLYLRAKAEKDKEICNYYIKMNISPQPLEPDTKYPFLLKLNNSPLRDNELEIKTTNSGLITSANLTSTDRTGDIAVEIAKAVAIFGIGIPSPTVPAREEEIKPLSCYPTILKHEEIIDFGDKYEIPIVFRDSSGLEVTGYILPPKTLNVSITPPGNTDIKNIYNDDTILNQSYLNQQNSQKEFRDPTVHYPLQGHNGILYRRDVTYKVELRNKDNKITETQISMPNLSPVSLVPFDNLFLVTTKNKAIFEDGMLISYETNRPSSALALATLPARIAEGYIKALTNFLQLRIDYASKDIAPLSKEQ